MSTEPLRLLLLEDNEGDALLVGTALEAEAPGEFAVTKVERLADALARIRTERFDAVLSDLGLPDSAGLATAQAIIARGPDLPLVVLTGESEVRLGRAAIELGAQDYLVKGEIKAQTIARTIRYAIDRKRLEAALRAANASLEQRVAERTAELQTTLAQLSESETRYRSVIESATDAIVIANQAGNIVGWNRAAERIFGYPTAEIMGQLLTSLMPQRYRDAHLAGVKRVLFGGESHVIGKTVELTGLRKDGSEFPLELSLATWEESGRFISGTMRDITERKQARTALTQAKEDWERTFDAVPELIAIVDNNYRVLRVNQAMADRLGRTKAQCEGHPCYEIVHRTDTPPEYCPQACVLRDGLSATVEAYDENLKGDFSLSASPLKDAHGRLTGCVLVLRDITDRKHAEKELHESEARFRGLVEQSIAGIYIIQDDKFAYVNPRTAEICDYASADELIGCAPLAVVAEQDRARVEESLRERLEGRIEREVYEFSIQRKDGSLIEVGVNSVRATYQGQPAIIGMMQDISEKKRAEEKIQQYVEQLKSALMSTVEVATTLSEMRDPYTAGHERRVAEIAVAIGAELGFDENRLQGLRVAGNLHDVGKITIPSEILSKPGKLSAIEYQLIQAHAHAGYDVLKNVTFSWPVAEIALQHHERMDGSGYPHGLKGEAILLDARIMAVADVIEAMASHRPYREALGIEKALAEIERGRGTAYDPAVADACLKLFNEKRYTIPA